MVFPGKPLQEEANSETVYQRPDPKEAKNSVQSLIKGLRVLESFASGAEELTLTEVSIASGLDAGTTFRMLNTLVHAGYLVRIPDSNRFRLSLKVLDLGFNAIAHTDLRALVRPMLQSLAGHVNEAASFAVLEGSDVLYIERVRTGMTRLGIDIRIGTTIHAPITSIGLTILAFMPEQELVKTLEIPPRHSIPTVPAPDRKSLMGKLETIRSDGYLVGESLISNDLRLLAVPVLGPDGWATGAISVVAPSNHSSNEDLIERALDPMLEAARRIARAQEASGSASLAT
jgi:IclR family transcriptional regulator, pca regulon regulatory protein